jgi:hypothetical protein
VRHTSISLLCTHHLGLASTICKRGLYSIFGREIVNYTVIYSVNIQFWPTLQRAPFIGKHSPISANTYVCVCVCVSVCVCDINHPDGCAMPLDRTEEQRSNYSFDL